MWVLFDGGFVSVVENAKREGQLLVRARKRSDLLAFCRLAGRPAARIDSTPAADYRFRTSMGKATVGKALEKAAKRIDYRNFKGRVHEEGDEHRDAVYMAVWRALFELQRYE